MNRTILELRLKIAQLMLQILQLQNTKKTNKGDILYDVAKACLGKDMAPLENEYGCAEALNAVHKRAFGQEIGGGLSTYRMYQILRKDVRFRQVFNPLPGDIVISPTGLGNGNIKNGHVGVVSTNGKIMSNTSDNGLWLENYTFGEWNERYKIQGGFPVLYYRPV